MIKRDAFCENLTSQMFKWQNLIIFRHIQADWFQFSSNIFCRSTLANLSKINEICETFSPQKFLPVKHLHFDLFCFYLGGKFYKIGVKSSSFI